VTQDSVVENVADEIRGEIDTEPVAETTQVESEDEIVATESDIEEEIPIDLAEINRVCDQLQSDMAAHTTDETPIDSVVFEESVYYIETIDSGTASELPVEQDSMAIV